MANFRQRIEILTNGTTITNRLSGNKEMHPNSSKVIEYAKSFMAQMLENAEPGEYYDIDVTVTKQKNKKPTA